MANGRKSIDNRGFSLLELLVGVMILAIIVAPLLHVIVTSARTAAKSREMHNATLAAQNVVETMNSMQLGEILSDISAFKKSSGAGLGGLSDIASSAGLYTYNAATDTFAEITNYNNIKPDGEIYYIGLNDVASAKSTYDAMVELNANVFQSYNDNYITTYTEMNAVFAQPMDDGATLNNPDSIAANSFANQAVIEGISLGCDIDVDKSDFIHHMVRNIDINITRSGSGANAIVAVNARYTYTASYTFAVPVLDANGVPTGATNPVTKKLGTYSCDYVVYNGSAADFTSVNFFYYPNYNHTVSNAENIVINNKNGLAFTFFLVKQNTPGYTDGVKDGIDYDALYSANLSLKEPYDILRGSNSIASVYTNMNAHLGTGEELYTHSVFRVYNGIWFSYDTSTGTLVSSDDLNRLYNVKVDLYPVDTNFIGKPTLSFDASKLE